MEKEKFLTNLFRTITILTPALTLLKSMADKSFKKIEVELSVLSVYILIGVFLVGFMKGININDRPQRKDNDRG